MRRIVLWMVSTAALVVLLFTYRTSTSGPTTGTAGTAAYAPGSTGNGSGGNSSEQVVNGSVAETRWGPVQVRVTISGGKLSDVSVLQQPTGNRRDREINSFALPQLREQALQAQSAVIDGVSGATVTSDGYRESLLSALDAVHFSG